MTEPLPPEGAKARCLDCGEYLWMTNLGSGWADSLGRHVCLHRSTLPHVAGSVWATWDQTSQTVGKV